MFGEMPRGLGVMGLQEIVKPFSRILPSLKGVLDLDKKKTEGEGHELTHGFEALLNKFFMKIGKHWHMATLIKDLKKFKRPKK